MITNRFDILVSKYLTDELNNSEVLELENFLNTNKFYQKKFSEYINTNISIEKSKINLNSEELFKEFLSRNKKSKNTQFKKVFNYVAVVSGIILSALGISFLINSNNLNPRKALIIPDEDIVLYNENGKSKKIEIDYNKSLKDEFGRIEGLKIGEEIIYGIKLPVKTTTYTLKVPFGKKFGVTLSDGTKVYLNSGSSISYPNKFDNSKERIVKLHGEAYFEVAKNKKKPFIVKTDLLNVRVLGTKFNVSAYKDDKTNSVILIDGKVAISKSIGFENKKPKSILLKPNEKASVKREDEGKINVNSIVNINKYISWKEKELEFKNDKFMDIVKKLERNFNVKIVSNNNKLNNIEFTGNFNKQDVFDILDAFRVHTPFEYRVEDNNILIQKK